LFSCFKKKNASWQPVVNICIQGRQESCNDSAKSFLTEMSEDEELAFRQDKQHMRVNMHVLCYVCQGLNYPWDASACTRTKVAPFLGVHALRITDCDLSIRAVRRCIYVGVEEFYVQCVMHNLCRFAREVSRSRRAKHAESARRPHQRKEKNVKKPSSWVRLPFLFCIVGEVRLFEG